MEPRSTGAAVDGAAVDRGASECDPACEAGEECVLGACVAAVPNGDGDGVPQGADCDDSDASCDQ